MKLLLHNRITARKQGCHDSFSSARLSVGRRKAHIYNKGVSLAAYAFMAALSLSGCSQIEDDLSGCPASDASESSYPVSRIVLRITTSGDSSADDGNSTRASGPTGGEPSVYETGTEAEYKVETAIAFLYEDAGSNGINDSANDGAEVTPIVFESMASNEAGSGNIDHTYTSEEQNANLTGTYKTLVVANPPSAWLDTYKNATGLTLNDIRVLTVDALQNGDGDFIMSSSEEGEVTIGGGSSSGTTTIEATVQRVAARVDYKASGTYTIGTGTTNIIYNEAYKGAKVTIQGAALINCFKYGSYLFKRVTTSTYGSDDVPDLPNDGITYLGKESVTYENDVATSGNYVIDPKTTSKNGTVLGSTCYDNYYSGEADSEQKVPSYWSTLIGNASSSQASVGDGYTRLGYTMENTTFALYTSKMYSTGVVFKALFEPNSSTLVNSYYTDHTYSSGDTFFKYNDVLYATLEDLMAAMWGKELVSKFLNASGLSDLGFDTYSELQTYLETTSIDPLGYRDMLISGSSFVSLSSYLSTTFGYSCTSGAVTIDTSTYSALLADNVTTYEKGICYYVWWIRHSNDGSDLTNGIMEYSIVRNNVYKLEVSSVSTLGGAIPTEGLYMNVYVEPWALLEEETIDM